MKMLSKILFLCTSSTSSRMMMRTMYTTTTSTTTPVIATFLLLPFVEAFTTMGSSNGRRSRGGFLTTQQRHVSSSSLFVSRATAFPPSSSLSMSTSDFPTSSSSSSSFSTEDSAISRSRKPFRMPKNSPDDSTSSSGNEKLVKNWNEMGLWTELIEKLEDLNFDTPTPVQSLVIPALLQEEKGKDETTTKYPNLTFLAATGSGKTLAYVLPILQQIKTQEVFVAKSNDNNNNTGNNLKRPKCLILAPTRELVTQIKDVIKEFCHVIKLSSQSLIKSQDKSDSYNHQKKLLNRPIDIVVATPGQFIKHWKDNNVFISKIQHVVLDEMDTLLEQGFHNELQTILYPMLYSPLDAKRLLTMQQNKDIAGVDNNNVDIETPQVVATAPRIIMTSATMTQAIQKMLGGSVGKNNDDIITAKRNYSNNKEVVSNIQKKLIMPAIPIVKAPGLHKAVPRLEQIFIDVGNVDKISLLIDVVASQQSNGVKQREQRTRRRRGSPTTPPVAGTTSSSSSDKEYYNPLTMIFCNTASSCRAVQYALAEARIDSLSYHGELNSLLRSENLRRFIQAGTATSTSTSTSTSESDYDDFEGDDDNLMDTLPAPKAPTIPNNNPNILVCTDLAARGIDIPFVEHVIMFDFPLNSLDYIHRSGRTCRGNNIHGKVTCFVTKRDKVLALAIENAVINGLPLDGLSSRKSDYLVSGRLHPRNKGSNNNNSNKKKDSNKRSSFGGNTKKTKTSGGSSSSSGRRSRK